MRALIVAFALLSAALQPAHADDCVTLHLGHGRERAGTVGSPQGVAHGFNAYKLRASGSPWVATGLKLTPTRTGAIGPCALAAAGVSRRTEGVASRVSSATRAMACALFEDRME